MRVLLVATVALLAGWGAVARADDAGLWRAYNSHGREIDRAMTGFERAMGRFNAKPSTRRAKAVIAANGRVIRLVRKLIHGVAAESASSDNGATAKRFALKGLREWRDMHVHMTRAMRAFIHRNRAAARKWIRRAIRAGNRSLKHIDAADKAFKQAGYPPPSQKRVAAHV